MNVLKIYCIKEVYYFIIHILFNVILVAVNLFVFKLNIINEKKSRLQIVQYDTR